MKTLYFDLIGGASGDMILGSLIDAGVPVPALNHTLEGLRLKEFEVQVSDVTKNGFRAKQVKVVVEGQPPERHLDQIRKIIQDSSLEPELKLKALEIFQLIAETESGIHNLPLESVHLHELGGTDTIVDIVGCLAGLDYLGIDRIVCSPLPLGKGFIPGSHGDIPLPAPATLGLLAGIPVYGRDINAELVTPTAAALIRSLADDFGPLPALKIESVGYGAGQRDLPFPNLLRAVIGESPSRERRDQLAVLETNLDDLNPEVYSYLVQRLFEAGALDVALLAIQMKKNRPGTQIQVLSEQVDADRLRGILFEETTTLGVRQYLVERFSLPRRIEQVETPYGTVRVKIADLGGNQLKVSPEYEDCARLAREHQVPLQSVYQEAMHSYRASTEG